MASAQVLPNNAAASTAAKKKELLAAGKRKLEEFRKKKALEKEKKPASAHQSRDSNDKLSSQTAQVSYSDNDEVGSSNRADEATDALSRINGAVDSLQNGVHGSDGGLFSSPPPFLNKVGSYGNAVSAQPKVNEAESLSPMTDFKVSDVDKVTRGESGMYNRYQSGHATSEANDYHPSTSHGSGDSSRELDNNNNFSLGGLGSSQTFVSSISSESTGTSFGERRFGNFFGHVPTPHSTLPTAFEAPPISLKSDQRHSDHALADSAKTTSTSRKSRPSFLDTIKVSNPSPSPLSVERNQVNSIVSSSGASQILYTESKMAEAYRSYGPSHSDNASEKSFDLPNYANNGSYPFNGVSNGNWMDHEQMYRSKKQDEDFTALEQHIEDLTQEKFSLQRAIEASRSLAESLAAENSTLTESYNQQGFVVNQLKFEMEILQEVIRGQSAELEAIKSEYGNVLLECNAADERAKLLASEVISLEEKALRLRSNELKLERQLETAQSEASSLKKKIFSLERERQDLQASIVAFQEEKKMLQTKLRRSSVDGNPTVDNNCSSKKNASTSTNDLVNEESADGTANSSPIVARGSESHLESNDLNSIFLPENSELLQVGSLTIPGDQMGVIHNINALLSELALEKEELIRTLKAESSESSKLKELNQEMSRRLEIQTQRLELLTAQNMAGENVLTAQPDLPSMDNRVIYADEGDEVVERVLGWIMKLFPGGPSKRRTSKLI